jgi:hypothetical protein
MDDAALVWGNGVHVLASDHGRKAEAMGGLNLLGGGWLEALVALRGGAESRRMNRGCSRTMRFRIAMWASAGFLVAGFWALFAIATFPSTNERIRPVWTLVSLTCPVAIAGRHYPISLYEVLTANAVTYALVGLIVEALRHQLHLAK